MAGVRLGDDRRQHSWIEPLGAVIGRVVAPLHELFRVQKVRLDEVRGVGQNHRPFLLEIAVGVDDVVGQIVERPVGTGSLHLAESLLVQPHGMPPGGGDAAVGEHHVDAVRLVDEVLDPKRVPANAGGVLGVEDPVTQVLMQDLFDVMRPGDVVVVSVAEWRHDESSLEIDHLSGRRRCLAGEHAADREHDAAPEPLAVEPLAVDEPIALRRRRGHDTGSPRDSGLPRGRPGLDDGKYQHTAGRERPQARHDMHAPHLVQRDPTSRTPQRDSIKVEPDQAVYTAPSSTIGPEPACSTVTARAATAD